MARALLLLGEPLLGLFLEPLLARGLLGLDLLDLVSDRRKQPLPLLELRLDLLLVRGPLGDDLLLLRLRLGELGLAPLDLCLVAGDLLDDPDVLIRDPEIVSRRSRRSVRLSEPRMTSRTVVSSPW